MISKLSNVQKCHKCVDIIITHSIDHNVVLNTLNSRLREVLISMLINVT